MLLYHIRFNVVVSDIKNINNLIMYLEYFLMVISSCLSIDYLLKCLLDSCVCLTHYFYSQSCGLCVFDPFGFVSPSKRVARVDQTGHIQFGLEQTGRLSTHMTRIMFCLIFIRLRLDTMHIDLFKIGYKLKIHMGSNRLVANHKNTVVQGCITL